VLRRFYGRPKTERLREGGEPVSDSAGDTKAKGEVDEYPRCTSKNSNEGGTERGTVGEEKNFILKC